MEKISIVCAVRNEKETIDIHLSSLVNQTYRNKEIFVIDDESYDGTTEIAKEYAERYKYIHYKRIRHKKGASHTDARLEGIKKTKGNILCIVDADAYYTKQYLTLCVQRLKGRNVGGVIGKMRMWDPKKIIAKYRDAWYTYRFDNEALINKEIKAGRMGAWVFKKAVYDMIGGYNPRDRYGEDVDLAKRMQNAGFKVVYEPKAVWFHKWEDSIKEIIKKHFEVGRLNYYHSKNDIKIWTKVSYFLMGAILLICSIIFPPLLVVSFIYALPLFGITLWRFYLCRMSKNRVFMLLYPLLAYIINIPYALGFISKIVFK